MAAEMVQPSRKTEKETDLREPMSTISVMGALWKRIVMVTLPHKAPMYEVTDK
jgi:hypothetical protein